MALQDIVEQTVTGHGYELVEMDRSAGGLLRITIDLPYKTGVEQSLNVEDCEKVTRQLQFALEVEGTRNVVASAVQEATSVARACGVSIPEDIIDHILKIPAAMPNQMSSTAQDLARGKPSEIDFLNGYVVRKGAELGIPTPTNQTLQVVVKLTERGKAISGRRT